jgi:hypothetical protein
MDQERSKLDPGCLIQKSHKKYITNIHAGKAFYDTFYDNHWTVHLDADKIIDRGFSDMQKR